MSTPIHSNKKFQAHITSLVNSMKHERKNNVNILRPYQTIKVVGTLPSSFYEVNITLILNPDIDSMKATIIKL